MLRGLGTENSLETLRTLVGNSSLRRGDGAGFGDPVARPREAEREPERAEARPGRAH